MNDYNYRLFDDIKRLSAGSWKAIYRGQGRIVKGSKTPNHSAYFEISPKFKKLNTKDQTYYILYNYVLWYYIVYKVYIVYSGSFFYTYFQTRIKSNN